MPRCLAKGYCRTLRVSTRRCRAGWSGLGRWAHSELSGFFLRSRLSGGCRRGLLFGSRWLSVLRSVILRGVQSLFERRRRRNRSFGRTWRGRSIRGILLGQPQRKGDCSLCFGRVNGLGDLSRGKCSLRQRSGCGKRRGGFARGSHSGRRGSRRSRRCGCRHRILGFRLSPVALVKAVLFIFALVACFEVRKIFSEISIFFFGGITVGLGDIPLRRSEYRWNRGGHCSETMQDSCQSQVKEKTGGVESKTTRFCRLAIENRQNFGASPYLSPFLSTNSQ